MGLGHSGRRYGLENAVHNILERPGGQQVESDAGRHQCHSHNRLAFVGTEVEERAEIDGHAYLLPRARILYLQATSFRTLNPDFGSIRDPHPRIQPSPEFLSR